MTTEQHLKLGKTVMIYLHGHPIRLFYFYTDLKALPMYFKYQPIIYN